MKVVIAGSRSLHHKHQAHMEQLRAMCDEFEDEHGVITMIVSGKATGPDKLGEAYAAEKQILIKEFPANWDMQGRAAGIIRNKEMAEFADAAIIMWDGESKGTKHMMDCMKKLNKPYLIRTFKPIVEYKHHSNGEITVTAPRSPSMDDPAYD